MRLLALVLLCVLLAAIIVAAVRLSPWFLTAVVTGLLVAAGHIRSERG